MADLAPVQSDLPAIGAPAPARVAPPLLRWLCLAGLVGALIWPVLLAIMFINLGGPDFEYFYKAGRSIADGGVIDSGYDVVAGVVSERGTLDWYWPFVHRLMSVFATLPYRYAGYAWITLNVLAILATIWMLGRHVSDLPPQDWAVTQLVPFLLLFIYWMWELRLNQINALTMLLMVGSYVAWEKGRRVQAGFWIGLAVLIKITPGLLVLWYVLKRQWRTVGAATLTILLAGPVSDIAAFGVDLTRETYRDWLHRSITVGSHRGLILNQREMDWRNQALGAVVGRWLHPTSFTNRFDNDPRVDQDYRDAIPRMINVVNLPTSTVATIVNGLALAILLALMWIARRPAAGLTVWRTRGEWALFMLGMLCLMPVMRLYHAIWALPAITVLGGLVHRATWRRPWSRLAVVCLLLATATQLALIPDDKAVNAGGTVLLAVVLIALPLVAALARRRTPGDAPPEERTPHG
jgi:hypothetical protein